MKKIMKMMAMALVAVAMTVGFAACSSSDDDSSTQIYTKGITAMKASGSDVPGVMGQIEDSFNNVFTKASPFTYEGGDSKLKTEAEKIGNSITISWGNCTGTFTYQITNVKSGQVIYSKTFTSPSK